MSWRKPWERSRLHIDFLGARLDPGCSVSAFQPACDQQLKSVAAFEMAVAGKVPAFGDIGKATKGEL